MEHGRTGARYRFLIPTPGSSRAVNLFINFFAATLAFFVLLGCAAVARRALREVASPEGVLHRLLRAPTADDLARGRTWGVGTLRTADGAPLCYVERQHYVSGKNGGWRTDSWAWVGDAPTVDLGGAAHDLNPRAVGFDPLEPAVVGDEAPYRARVRFEYGGRLRAQCVAAGESVFADLCVGPIGAAGSCADGSPSVLTRGPGGPAARVRSHANNTAGGLTLAFLAAALLALYGWRVVRVGAVADALVGWNPAPPPPSRAGVWAALGLAVGFALAACLFYATASAATPYYVGGYAFAALTLGAAAVGVVLAAGRRRTLLRAMEPVDAAETARLARVGEGMAELEVRVRPDAPTVDFPGLPPCAWLRVEVKRILGSGRSQRTYVLRSRSWPDTVPVEDETGAGLVDLTDTALDLRAVSFHATGDEARGLLQALAATPFGSTGAEQDAVLSLDVEASYLAPGEALYLLGHIRRVEDPNASTTYRAMGTLPVISAASDRRLIAHAGGEATLRRGLSRERTYLAAASGLVGGLGAALVAALAWLATRA